jgi:hypothetical protein
MNGPDHYAEAERLLQLAEDAPRALLNVDRGMTDSELDDLRRQATDALGGGPIVVASPGIDIDVSPALLAAQVHATLAHAAAAVAVAQAANTVNDTEPFAAFTEWHEVTR